jgi:muramidase (phage lysozyme)
MARIECSRNLAAFLDMLAFSEGTIGRGDDGYDKLVNPGKTFSSYATHPNVSIQVSPKLKSTAAGRYQFLSRDWLHYKAQMKLPDFGPVSQDKWAIQLIRERRALADIEAGRIGVAIDKCRNIWASLPGAGYNQPEHSRDKLLAKFVDLGGVLA